MNRQLQLIRRNIISMLAVLVLLTGSACPALAAAGVNGRVLALDDKGLVAGVVPGAAIEFRNLAGQIVARATADAHGYYKTDLAAGTYVYKVQAAGFKNEDVGRGITVTLSEGYAAYHFSLTRGANKPVQKPLPATAVNVGILHGQVLEKTADGKLVAIPNARIALRLKTGSRKLIEVLPQGTNSKQPGQYEVVLEADTYLISVMAPGFETFVDPASVSIKPGNTSRDLVLTRPSPKSPSGQGLKGVVTVHHTKGASASLPQVKVSIRPLRGTEGTSASLNTDAQGKFAHDMKPGAYQIVAEAPGYQTAYSDPTDVFSGRYTVVNLALAPNKSVAQKPQQEYIVAATVYTTDDIAGVGKFKRGMSGAEIILRPKGEPDAHGQRTRTDWVGHASLKVSRAGSYEAHVQVAGYRPVTVPVEIRNPGETRVEIELVELKKVEAAADKIKAPRLENLTLESAQALAKKLGLEARQQGAIASETTSDPMRAGKTLVKTQSIASGTLVDKGAVIQLTLVRFVTSKQSKVAVPSLQNLSMDAAQATAKKLELDVRRQGPITTKTSADLARVGKTLVDTQSITAGTLVEKGTVIHVALAQFVAPKQTKVIVPALENMSIEAAQAAGKKLELEVRQHGQITTKSAMDPARIGKTLVESQSITAGTHVEKGTVVHVTLARMIAPKQSKVIVPALENMSLEAAQAVARKLELEVRQQGPIMTKSAMGLARVGKTLVETQSIAAGTSVEKGTVIPVTLARFVASKQSKVSVPALENMSFEAAQSAAKKLELEVRPQGPIATKSSADPSRVGKTLVETQSVAAGTLVEKGAVLHVTLARFTAAKDAKVQVPALVGLPEGKVRELLKNAGLVLEVKGDSRRGLASNQWPAAGAMVAKGSTVSVAFAAPDSKVRVPDLRGLTEGEARSALEKTGLRIGAVNTREETSSDAKKSGPPRVTTQSVEPGAMAPRGAAIDVQLLRYIPRKSPHQRGDR